MGSLINGEFSSVNCLRRNCREHKCCIGCVQGSPRGPWNQRFRHTAARRLDSQADLVGHHERIQLHAFTAARPSNSTSVNCTADSFVTDTSSSMRLDQNPMFAAKCRAGLPVATHFAVQLACAAATVNGQGASSSFVSIDRLLENNSFSLAECMWQVLGQVQSLSTDLQHRKEFLQRRTESAKPMQQLDRLKAALRAIQHQHPDAVYSILHVIDSLHQDELAARAEEGTSCYWAHIECGMYRSSGLPAPVQPAIAIVLVIHSKLTKATAGTDPFKIYAYRIDAAGLPTSQRYNSSTQFLNFTSKEQFQKPRDAFTILVEGKVVQLAASKGSRNRQFKLQYLLEAISSSRQDPELCNRRQQAVNAASNSSRRRRGYSSANATSDSHTGDGQCKSGQNSRRRSSSSSSSSSSSVGNHTSSSVEPSAGRKTSAENSNSFVVTKLKVVWAMQLLEDVETALTGDLASYQHALQCQDPDAMVVQRKLREVLRLALHLDETCHWDDRP